MKTSQRSKDHLIEVATKLFAEEGFGAVTETQLLDTAKVSRGILVYHFHDKTGVLREILRQQIPLFLQILPSKSHISTPEDNLVFAIQRWISFLNEHKLFWQCYFPLTISPQYRPYIYYPTLDDFYENYHQFLLNNFRQIHQHAPDKEVMAFEIFRKGLFSTFLTGDAPSIHTLQRIWCNQFKLKTSTNDL